MDSKYNVVKFIIDSGKQKWSEMMNVAEESTMALKWQHKKRLWYYLLNFNMVSYEVQKQCKLSYTV